ncbi:lipase B [Diplogelasinospora grovesii]|uniref:Lipase B n=1 Tax=Diplogelasinospora grovesii TaxID=303347 RepID=A0AAN6N0V8_9PEZI|nr:lipase B [Diplogelasinospora grovesii]
MYDLSLGCVAAAALLLLIQTASAAPPAPPAPAPPLLSLQGRGGLLGDVTNGVATLVTDVLPSSISDVLDKLLGATPTTSPPTSGAELQSRLSSIWNQDNASADFYGNVQRQIEANILPTNLLTAGSQALVAPVAEEDSTSNVNPRSPSQTIYPKKDSTDAPYSAEEAQLRAAIHIPASFTYGEKQPVIFVPGTGTYGGEAFGSNLRKLLTGTDYADPVWLNVPGALLGDAQVNAEYVAYAINYVSGVSGGRNVSVISWSQGGLDTQWAFTFWPSTRGVVSNFLPVSPDFHGTIFAYAICLSDPLQGPEGRPNFNPCDPSVIQQEYTSNLVSALRARGGADAYVPTTSFYSGVYDEIVEPQQGTGASAYIGDARGVGAANIEVQSVCPPTTPGGSFYGHANMMAHPLTAALVVDALTHAGPGDVSRIDLARVCADYIAPGLTVFDAVATAGQIVNAATRLLAYQPKMTYEPSLMAYAA